MRPTLAVLSVLAFACTPASESGPNEAAAASPRGKLELLLTDAPIDGVSAVNICFERIDVTFAAGDDAPPTTVIDNPGTFDLLQLRNGVTATLGIADLPSGFIQQIRVVLCAAGNTVVVDGIEHPLTVPSGTESGLKLTRPGGFEIRDNLTTTVIVDFDASESIHLAPGHGFLLRPVVHLLDAIFVSITSPAAGALAASQPIAVNGTYGSRLPHDPVVRVDVNGAEATLAPDGTYSVLATTSISSASAALTATATSASGIEARTAIIVRVLAVDPARSSVTVEPSPIQADGESSGVVRIQLATSTGAAIPDLPASEVMVEALDASVTPPTAATDAAGITTATITSTTAGLKPITVRVGNGADSQIALVGFASFSPPYPGCGDGVLALGEYCDDGNVVSGDGCRADCLGAEVPQRGFGEYVFFDVNVAGNGRYIVECASCERIIEASAHVIPNPFRLASREGDSIVRVSDVYDDGQVELRGPPLNDAFTAVAFDVVVEQAASIHPGAAHLFFSLTEQGDLTPLSWPEFICQSEAARCSRRPTGEIARIFLPNP